MAMSPAIVMGGVRYRYPETTTDVLDGIDLTVQRGEWVGVVGPTNAGKSTLCYAIMGLATEFFAGRLVGEVSVLGTDIRKEKVIERSRRVGMLFQNPFTQISGARERVDDEVAFGPENHGLPPEEVRDRVATALEQVGLTAFAGRHPLDLSGGQLQRLALAGLLAMRPDLLLLDEPTSQLDPAGTKSLFEVLSRLHQDGVTIMMVEQKLEAVAELCQRVIALAEGRIIADGSPDGVFDNAQVRRTVGAPIYLRLAAAMGLSESLPVTFQTAVSRFRG
ncbi:MAG TPA: ABC transporter ATP-binding protein [Candidatus Dormibacteraeota bacterium]